MPRALLCVAALFAASGCISGSLPTVRTDRIEVQDVNQQGLALDVRVIATNERHDDVIRVDALRVHVTVADQDLGTVDVAESWELPPNQPVLMQTQVVVPVNNLPGLAMTAANGPVPYHLDGRAHVLNVGWTVEFSYDGEIPQEQLINAAAGALPFGFGP